MIAYPDYVMSQSSQFAGNISLVWYYNGGFYFGNWVVND